MAQTACRRVAIWIDAEEAILCLFGVGPFEDPIPYGPGDEWSCYRVEARVYQHKRQYYEAVLSHLRPEDEILILGPGAAKRELLAQLTRHGGHGNKVLGLRYASRLAEVELVFPTGEEWRSVDMGPAQEETVLPRPALHPGRVQYRAMIPGSALTYRSGKRGAEGKERFPFEPHPSAVCNYPEQTSKMDRERITPKEELKASFRRT